MIFSCGLTSAACIRAQDERREYFTQWHRHFAWWPREIGVRGDYVVCVWLQWIRRKGVYHESSYNSPAGYAWEYRLECLDEMRSTDGGGNA